MNTLRSRTYSMTAMLSAFMLVSQVAFAQQGEVQVNGVTLAYESFGEEGREAILLVAGTGMQLTAWPPELCRALVDAGYRVIIYDNRDVGLSTKLDAAGPPDWVRIFEALSVGAPPPLAYTVDDMAKDAVDLLDALGISKAHIVGVSGGAIIAQIVAATYPEYTLSLTTIMATTGNPALPPMNQELQNLLMSLTPPPPSEKEAAIDRHVRIAQALGSPGYPVDEATLREVVRRDVERSYYPDGEARQAAAAFVAGDRREQLKTIMVPTVVVHGAEDPLVPVEAGRDVAANIPGAELRVIPGMGHDMPVELIDELTDAITTAARRASSAE